MKAKKSKNKLIIYISICVALIIYLLEIYTQGLSKNFILDNYIKTVFMSLLAGSFAYISIYGLNSLFNKYKKSKSKLLDAKEVDQLDIFKVEEIFNDSLNHIHGNVVSYISIPDFDSELVDDMREKIISLWRLPCMAYTYGLLVICFLDGNKEFTDSHSHKTLQTYVMQKMAEHRKQLALEYGDENLTNDELTKNVTEIFLNVSEAVCSKSSNENKIEDVILNELIEYLALNTNKKLMDSSDNIKLHSKKIIRDICGKIDNCFETVEYGC